MKRLEVSSKPTPMSSSWRPTAKTPPSGSAALAAALNLDIEHPYRDTRLTTDPENRLPINDMAVYSKSGHRWVRASAPTKQSYRVTSFGTHSPANDKAARKR